MLNFGHHHHHHHHHNREEEEDLCISSLKACLWPSQSHRVTSGLFTKANLTEAEYNTKHAHFTNVKHNKHNPKVNPFGIALIKKMPNKIRRCWYH